MSEIKIIFYTLTVLLFCGRILCSRTDISLPYKNLRNVTCHYHEIKYTCDCGDMDDNFVLLPLKGQVYQISISNCKSLSVPSNILADTQGLRSVTFTNVDNLVLEEHSLAFPKTVSSTPLILEFQKVNIDKIHSLAISGNIEEITFIGGSIATIRAFGFTSLAKNAVLLKFESVWIDIIEAQAFKKFSVDQMEITNCYITSNLPSKSFYEVDVQKYLKISNVTFREIHTRALSFKYVSKFQLLDSKFKRVEAEWITAQVNENIWIKNNDFGNTSPLAFTGLSIENHFVGSEKLELRFINNSIGMGMDILPLEFNKNFQVNLYQLQYRNNFPCEMLENRQPKISFFKSNQDAVFFLTQRQNQSLSVAKIIDHDCPEKSYVIYIIIGVVVAFIIIAIIVGLVIYQMARNKKRRKMDIVMPEPRTYKETQIVLQIENAGLLKTDL